MDRKKEKMQVKCLNCGLEDIGRYKKLIERGWKIFFLYNGNKVVRCKKCKPKIKDRIKTIINKDYKPEMYYDIRTMINKLRTLKGLKTKEELMKESLERRMKKRKHYKYQRNTRKKKGSKSIGFANLSRLTLRK